MLALVEFQRTFQRDGGNLDIRLKIAMFAEKFEIMTSLRYPVGMQTFSKIIEGGYTYVHKTAYIKPLLEQGQFTFLSRPRRFGKSLLLSTLEAYFEGRRELFKGLSADSMNLDWTPRPVLYFDFNTGSYDRPDGLQLRLMVSLKRHEDNYGITSTIKNDGPLRFESLINEVHNITGQKVMGVKLPCYPYLLAVLCGTQASAESHGYEGRSDV